MDTMMPDDTAADGGHTLALQRQQLVRLHAGAWSRLIRSAESDEQASLLLAWRERDLPLVVSRQPAGQLDSAYRMLGLPAPARWNRVGLTLRVGLVDIKSVAAFPTVAEVAPQLAGEVRGAWGELCCQLALARLDARVYGSYGWQHITDMPYVRSDSDLDLCVAVSSLDEADRAAAILDGAAHVLPRLDGELILLDGRGVAWREWLRWRAGWVQSVLAKGIDDLVVMRTASNRGATSEALVERRP
jgi:phosphoribosyl-dephospho-CoA transferase